MNNILINLSHIEASKNIIEFFLDKNISNTTNIFLYDPTEIDRIWPITNYDDDLLYQIFTSGLQNTIYYISGDFFISKQLDNLKKSINSKITTEIIPITHPFVFEYKEKKFITDKKYSFITLVSSPRFYRHYILSKIYKNNSILFSNCPHRSLNDNQSISDSNLLGKNFFDDFLWDTTKNLLYDKNSSNYLKLSTPIDMGYVFDNDYVPLENIRKLTETNEECFNKTRIDKTIPIEYFQSCFELVQETYIYDGVLLTEKTWRPIVQKMPFITFSSKNYYKILTKLGFKLYDEIFDYSFDDNDNIKDRIDSIVKQVLHYSKYDIDYVQNVLLKKIEDKIQFNYDHYFNKITPIRKYFDLCILLKDFDKIKSFDYINKL